MNYILKQRQKLETNPFLMSLLLISPPQFQFQLLQNCFLNYSIFISKLYQVQLNQIQWIQHIDNICICCSSLLFTSFANLFGAKNTYLLSSLIQTISFIVSSIFIDSFKMIITVRIFQAFSFSILLSCTTSLVTQTVEQNQIAKTISYSVVITASSQIISSLIFPFILQKYGLTPIYLILTISSIMHTIYCSIMLFEKKYAKKMFKKVNYKILFFLQAGTIFLISSFALLYQIESFTFAFILLILGSISMLVFYELNKFSQKPALPMPVFNTKYTSFILAFLFQTISIQSEIFQQPIIFRQIFNMSLVQNGLLICLNKAISLTLATPISFIIKKFITKKIIILCNFIILTSQIIICISLKYYCKLWFIETLQIISQLFYLQLQLTIMSHNTLGTKSEIRPFIASILSYSNRFSSSVGIAVALSSQKISGQVSAQIVGGNSFSLLVFGVQISYICSVVCTVMSLFFGVSIQVGEWEGGKE